MKHFQKKTCRAVAALMGLCLLATMLLCACGGGNASDYTITIKGVKLAVGQTMDDVSSVYGTPVAFDESASCGGIPGTDRVYQYPGFTIKTTPAAGGKNVICLINLTDDTYTTDEGLYIGSTVAAVKTALGEPTVYSPDAENPTLIVYETASMKLQFGVRDNFVTNIRYSAK